VAGSPLIYAAIGDVLAWSLLGHRTAHDDDGRCADLRRDHRMDRPALLFGVFLFGVVMPREATDEPRAELLNRIGEFHSVLLLPVFFIMAGLKVDPSGTGVLGIGELALILLVAVSGKFGDAFRRRPDTPDAREAGGCFGHTDEHVWSHRTDHPRCRPTVRRT
jgi:hypothetical protein